MLLNTATDMVYVGQTTTSLKERIDRHRKKGGRSTGNRRLWNALNDFPWFVWEVVVLEHCLSLDDLDVAEERWIADCHSIEPNVGYNGQQRSKHSKPNSSETRELKSKVGRKNTVRKKADMTPHELEKYKEWGRKGARVSIENRKKAQKLPDGNS